MAAKPRIMVRLDPGVLATLEWYARGRGRTTADLAGELVQGAVAAALADADLRAALVRHAGPPPDVPLVALVDVAPPGGSGLAAAFAELDELAEALMPVSFREATRARWITAQLEKSLLLLGESLEELRARRRAVPFAEPVAEGIEEDLVPLFGEGASE